MYNVHIMNIINIRVCDWLGYMNALVPGVYSYF